MFSKKELTKEQIDLKIKRLMSRSTSGASKEKLANELYSMLSSLYKSVDTNISLICLILVSTLDSDYLCEELSSQALKSLKAIAQDVQFQEILARTPGIFEMIIKKLHGAMTDKCKESILTIIWKLISVEVIKKEEQITGLFHGLFENLESSQLEQQNKNSFVLNQYNTLWLLNKLAAYPDCTLILIKTPKYYNLLIKLFLASDMDATNKIFVLSLLLVIALSVKPEDQALEASAYQTLQNNTPAIFLSLELLLKEIQVQKEKVQWNKACSAAVNTNSLFPKELNAHSFAVEDMGDCFSSKEDKKNALNQNCLINNTVSYIWLYLGQHSGEIEAIEKVIDPLMCLLPLFELSAHEWVNFEQRYQSMLTDLSTTRNLKNQQDLNYAEKIFEGLSFSPGVFKSLMHLIKGTSSDPTKHHDIKLAALYSLELICNKNKPIFQIVPLEAYLERQKLHYKRRRQEFFTPFSNGDKPETGEYKRARSITELNSSATNPENESSNEVTSYAPETEEWGAPFAEGIIGHLPTESIEPLETEELESEAVHYHF